LTVYYSADLEQFLSDPECTFVLPANRCLRIGGFPFSLPVKIKGIGIQKRMNLLTETAPVELWEPVVCENLILVPGDSCLEPDLHELYRKVRLCIADTASLCCIYPVTVPWGFPVRREIDAVSLLRYESFDIRAVLENIRDYRFPARFYNSLMRELSEMKDRGSSPDELGRHAAGRAGECGVDAELLLYCLGLRSGSSE
jgi:hypothetical protein